MARSHFTSHSPRETCGSSSPVKRTGDVSCDVIDVIGLFLSVETEWVVTVARETFSDCVDDHGVVLPTRGGVTTGVLAEMVGSDGS
jgi:hypothetical protein